MDADPRTNARTDRTVWTVESRRRYDGGCAPVEGGASQGRVGDRDGKGGSEPLAQRNGQREAGEAAAADQHVRLFVGPFACHHVDVLRPGEFPVHMISAAGGDAISPVRLTRGMKRV